MLMHKDAPIGRATALKAVLWLKRNFGQEIEEAVKGTAYSVDTICGIACQETAYFWANMLERLTPEEVCTALCARRMRRRSRHSKESVSTQHECV